MKKIHLTMMGALWLAMLTVQCTAKSTGGQRAADTAAADSVAQPATQSRAVCIDGVYYELKDDEATVVNGHSPVDTTAYRGDVNLPESVTWQGQTYRVTTIADSAFYRCRAMRSVAIPASVDSVGRWAFRDCTGLERVVVRDLAAWCRLSFGYQHPSPTQYAGCICDGTGKELLDLTIPVGVTSVGDGTFRGCRRLRSVVLPDGVTYIGWYAFYDCARLATVSIGRGIETICEGSFGNCEKLKKVVIRDLAAWSALNFGQGEPGSPVEYSGRAYAADGTEIRDLVIPDGVKRVGFGAFRGFTHLRSVVIPSSVTDVDDAAFAGCERLTSLVIGSNVKTFGSSTLANCEALRQVTCLAPTPPDYWGNEGGDHDFDLKRCRLVVPAGSVSAYREAEEWKDFGFIQGL